LVDHAGLLELKRATEGGPATIDNVGVHSSLPGYGHEGFHPDKPGPSTQVGTWDGTEFIIPLSPYRPDAGTIRALPGTHRSAPDFEPVGGSAMPPHPDEVRIEADAGDVFVFSSHLWRSETLNGGVDVRKGLWAS
jgi:ectoine hydroxylase-related dioxygenase (phytanoyl-CoA dioxygenase family)